MISINKRDKNNVNRSEEINLYTLWTGQSDIINKKGERLNTRINACPMMEVIIKRRDLKSRL